MSVQCVSREADKPMGARPSRGAAGASGRLLFFFNYLLHRYMCTSLLLLQAGVSQDRANKPLQDWQLQKLRAAAATGRRKIKVCNSCKSPDIASINMGAWICLLTVEVCKALQPG